MKLTVLGRLTCRAGRGEIVRCRVYTFPLFHLPSTLEPTKRLKQSTRLLPDFCNDAARPGGKSPHATRQHIQDSSREMHDAKHTCSARIWDGQNTSSLAQMEDAKNVQKSGRGGGNGVNLVPKRFDWLLLPSWISKMVRELTFC